MPLFFDKVQLGNEGRELVKMPAPTLREVIGDIEQKDVLVKTKEGGVVNLNELASHIDIIKDDKRTSEYQDNVLLIIGRILRSIADRDLRKQLADAIVVDFAGTGKLKKVVDALSAMLSAIDKK